MTEPATKSGATPEVKATQLGLVRQLRLMIRAIFASPVGRTLWVLIAATLFIIAATAYGQIRLNSWNRPFYDAISRRDLRDFFFQLGVFFVIAGFLLALNAAQRCLAERRRGRWESIPINAFTRMRENFASSPRILASDFFRPRCCSVHSPACSGAF